MKVVQLQVDPTHARELWRKYQSHVHRQTAADAEIAAIYKRIAQGKPVIRALESIRAAGIDERGMPKLAIMRADQAKCFWVSGHQHGTFRADRYAYRSQSKNIVVDNWPSITGQFDGRGDVPLIPVHLRPKRGLQNYHILWEAEWTRTYPADPYLLRRFGGDAWLWWPPGI